MAAAGMQLTPVGADDTGPSPCLQVYMGAPKAPQLTPNSTPPWMLSASAAPHTLHLWSPGCRVGSLCPLLTQEGTGQHRWALPYMGPLGPGCCPEALTLSRQGSHLPHSLFIRGPRAGHGAHCLGLPTHRSQLPAHRLLPNLFTSAGVKCLVPGQPKPL